jgi:hypothetical protein
MFSYISINWAGKPLRSLDVMLGYIRGTTTETGLEIEANLDESFYRKSVSYSHQDVDKLCLEVHQVCPQWNYTISPQSVSSASASCSRLQADWCCGGSAASVAGNRDQPP